MNVDKKPRVLVFTALTEEQTDAVNALLLELTEEQKEALRPVLARMWELEAAMLDIAHKQLIDRAIPRRERNYYDVQYDRAKALPVKLRVLRAERGVTLGQVEAETGVPINTLSRIERAEHYPRDATLAKLARFYGVPLEELL